MAVAGTIHWVLSLVVLFLLLFLAQRFTYLALGFEILSRTEVYVASISAFVLYLVSVICWSVISRVEFATDCGSVPDTLKDDFTLCASTGPILTLIILALLLANTIICFLILPQFPDQHERYMIEPDFKIANVHYKC
jgi:hypothetical protein